MRMPVTPGLDDGTHVEILSGLRGDEDVVKAGAASLVDGQPLAATAPDAR